VGYSCLSRARKPLGERLLPSLALTCGYALLFVVASTGASLAQLPGALPGAGAPGRDRPLPEAPVQPMFDLNIQAPMRSPIPRAVDEIQFQLSDIRVSGAVTLTPERLRPLYEGLIGKNATLADIFDVADRIEAEYRRDGYILVRAFVPPQRVADGIFNIDIVEGFVASVSFEGGDEATQDLLRAYLQPVLEARPLDLATIERVLLLVNDLPGVRVTGVLRPSPDTPGASDLIVSVATTRVTGGTALDNRGSHYTGRWTLTNDFAINAPFSQADQIVGSVALSSEVDQRADAQLRYRRPIGESGMIASFNGLLTRGQPGSTLRAFDLLTDSWALGSRLLYPLKRTRAESLILDGGLTRQDARVRTLGQPFSHDKWWVADIGASYIRNNFLGGALTASTDLAQGLSIAGATSDGSSDLSRSGGNTHFTKVIAGLRYTATLAGPVSLAAAFQSQYSLTPLITGEQIAFGGAQFGRGYEPGAITGDHGLGSALELRYSTGELPQYSITALQPYLFLDGARGWFIQPSGTVHQSLASTGVGVRVFLPNNIAASVELARTLTPVGGSDEGKRVTKILIDLSVRF
jgi:hemolysin activation/secretion protein